MRDKHRLFGNILLTIFILFSCNKESKISISNFTHKETVHYPVPIIRGTLPANADSIILINHSTDQQINGLVHQGKFILLPELSPGKNRMELVWGEETRKITLNYKPSSGSHKIKVFYITDQDKNTQYDSPLINDPQNYKQKLSTGFKLLQTFTADAFLRKGLPKKTFNLEMDENGEVIIHEIKSEKAKTWFHKTPSYKWYKEVISTIEKSVPLKENELRVAFINVTTFDKNQSRTIGDIEINSKHGALFGTDALYTWPNNVQDVFRAYSDSTIINPAIQYDNSNGRKTHFGMASTSMGKVLHEIGHGLGLPGSSNKNSIMQEGYNEINRAFTFSEPACEQQNQDNVLPYWSLGYADLLTRNRFFTSHQKEVPQIEPPSFQLEKDSIHITSGNGIHGTLFFRFNNGNLKIADENVRSYANNLPKEVSLSVKEIQKQVGDELFSVLSYDEFGNLSLFHVMSQEMLQ